MRFFTRKNPWYMALLIALQFGYGVFLLTRAEPDLFWGGFFLMCCGVNIGFSLSGNPPDQF